MSEEKWKQIGDLDYEVSTHGNVRRRNRTGRLLKLQRYVHISLTGNDGKNIRRQVHRLVAEAFLETPPSSKNHVNHKDGVHSNNQIENLEWMSPEENQLHAVNSELYGGRGETHGRAKLTEEQVLDIRRRYTGAYGEQTALGKEFGVTPNLISKIVSGEIWTHLDDCPEEPPRVARGVPHGAKLTEEQVVEIREKYKGKYGEQVALAREYGVPVSVVRKVVWGKSWKNLGLGDGLATMGENHGRAKLTDEQVREMRERFKAGESNALLAADYSLNRQIVRNITSGKTWKHLLEE